MQTTKCHGSTIYVLAIYLYTQQYIQCKYVKKCIKATKLLSLSCLYEVSDQLAELVASLAMGPRVSNSQR